MVEFIMIKGFVGNFELSLNVNAQLILNKRPLQLQQIGITQSIESV